MEVSHGNLNPVPGTPPKFGWIRVRGPFLCSNVGQYSVQIHRHKWQPDSCRIFCCPAQTKCATNMLFMLVQFFGQNLLVKVLVPCFLTNISPPSECFFLVHPLGLSLVFRSPRTWKGVAKFFNLWPELPMRGACPPDESCCGVVMVVCFCGRNDVDDVFGDYIPIYLEYIDIGWHTYSVYLESIYTYIWVVLRRWITWNADVWRSLEYA